MERARWVGSRGPGNIPYHSGSAHPMENLGFPPTLHWGVPGESGLLPAPVTLLLLQDNVSKGIPNWHPCPGETRGTSIPTQLLFYKGQVGNLDFHSHLAVTEQHVPAQMEQCQRRPARTESLNKIRPRAS